MIYFFSILLFIFICTILIIRYLRSKFSQFKVNHAIFYGVSEKEYVFKPDQNVYLLQTPTTLETLKHNDLTIFSWNIYKQKLSSSVPQLDTMIHQADLVLLQEARESETLNALMRRKETKGIQVVAFKDGYYSNGVMTIAKIKPLSYLMQKYSEPWIRFPKSGLITTYPLDNGQMLMVGNFHAINFSIGIKAFIRQVDAVVDVMQKHKGPIIFGGDFNTWKVSRMHYLKKRASSIGLDEIQYHVDERTKVLGKALDHIFIKDLIVEEAIAFNVVASDHNPIKLRLSTSI